GGTVLATGVPDELIRLADAAGFLILAHGNGPVAGAAGQDVVLPCIDVHPSHYHDGFALRPGFPTPFGASLVPGGINFAIYSRHARSCTLVLFRPGAAEPLAEIPFPAGFRVGDVFALTVLGLDPDDLEYGFRMDGPFAPAQGHR